MYINNIAFIIPIHPPYYHYIYDLIKKLNTSDIHIDIFLVFSSQNDFNLFQMKTDINPIIINEPLNTNSIVTFKKFYGLKQLIESKYEYFICCDAEIDIIFQNFTNENIHEKINNIFNNKKIYGGISNEPLVNKILSSSAKLFTNNYTNLQNITKNFSLYFWWSDLPVYKRTHLFDFFQTINYDNINFHHFDYIIYQYYLILNHNFLIINITTLIDIRWSLENLYTKDIKILNKLSDIDYGFSYITKKMYDYCTEYIISKKTFIIYHLDRK
jgi:hypothetical protein